MLRTLPHDGHAAPRRTLRFAHMRGDGLVAFAADHVEPRSTLLDGHPAADRFALMCTLARFLPDITLDIDGSQVSGRLGRPNPDTGRTPFHGASRLPPPTRPVAWLRWEVVGQSFLAECAVRGDNDGGWLLELPRAVEGSDRRLLPRWELGPGWRFEPLPSAPAALGAVMAVVDLSPVGASLHLDTREHPDNFPGQHVAGTLMAPGGEGLRIRCAVQHANLHPEASGVLLAVSFVGLGFLQTARLVEWLPAELPEEPPSTFLDLDPVSAHAAEGHVHGHLAAHGGEHSAVHGLHLGHDHGLHPAPGHALGHGHSHAFHPVLPGGGLPHAHATGAHSSAAHHGDGPALRADGHAAGHPAAPDPAASHDVHRGPHDGAHPDPLHPGAGSPAPTRPGQPPHRG